VALLRGRLLRAAIGIFVSAVALMLVVRQVDLAEAAAVLRTADPAWLGLMVAFLVVDLVVRGLRWQRLLMPIRRLAYARTMDYLLVGYVANDVLPARLGELVRSHYLGDREGISRTTTLGTVVVERVVDTTVLVAVASIAILVLRVRGAVADAVLVGIALAGLLVVGLVVALVAHRLPYADRVIARLERFPRVGELGRRLRGGLAVAARPRTLGWAVGLSLIAWGSSVLAMAAAGQSIGLELTIAQASLFSSGIALATAIPAGPGYLGTFELAGVTIGNVLGIPSDASFALAFLVHLGILAVTGVGGLVAFVRVWRRPSADVSAASAGPAAGPSVAAAGGPTT
jgi:uncharacterized protein (TIRG00374 family)